jgi:hypothetical protein
MLADLTARLSWINWENLGVNPNRRSVLTTLTLTAENMNNWQRSDQQSNNKSVVLTWTGGQNVQFDKLLAGLIFSRRAQAFQF